MTQRDKVRVFFDKYWPAIRAKKTTWNQLLIQTIQEPLHLEYRKWIPIFQKSREFQEATLHADIGVRESASVIRDDRHHKIKHKSICEIDHSNNN